jgi:hypothetical protein
MHVSGDGLIGVAGRLQGNNTLSSVSAHRNTDGTYSGTMALKNDGASASWSVATPPMLMFRWLSA